MASDLPIAVEIDAEPVAALPIEEQSYTKPARKIAIDAGGRHFSTTSDTLSLCPFFAPVLSGAVEPEEDGRFFVDCNPDAFAVILDFLRCGSQALPKSSEDATPWAMVELQARRFGLPVLADLAMPRANWGARRDHATLEFTPGGRSGFNRVTASCALPALVGQHGVAGTNQEPLHTAEVMMAMTAAGWACDSCTSAGSSTLAMSFSRPCHMRAAVAASDELPTAAGPGFTASFVWDSHDSNMGPFNMDQQPKFATYVNGKWMLKSFRNAMSRLQNCAVGQELVEVEGVPVSHLPTELRGPRSPTLLELIQRFDEALAGSPVVTVSVVVAS